MTREADLMDRFPNIQWREPIILRVGFDGPRHYACRFCIAMSGQRSLDVAALPTDRETVRAHIREAHPC
jgi:hypothetical protein